MFKGGKSRIEERGRDSGREREISIGKNNEYKKEKIFIWMF